MIYTVNHPEKDDCRDFTSKKAALMYAKKQDYTPVFIDVSENEEDGIISSIKIENDGKRAIL